VNDSAEKILDLLKENLAFYQRVRVQSDCPTIDARICLLEDLIYRTQLLIEQGAES
jgi:hypothetical protein